MSNVVAPTSLPPWGLVHSTVKVWSVVGVEPADHLVAESL